jgi:hypothetical protein
LQAVDQLQSGDEAGARQNLERALALYAQPEHYAALRRNAYAAATGHDTLAAPSADSVTAPDVALRSK